MLKAILHGKAGRIEQNNDHNVSWSSLFKNREDLLTSTIFERFAYLSNSIQQQLIKKCFEKGLGGSLEPLGDFESIHYWPRFTYRSATVEPDLILSFSSCHIIVEVKPPEGGKQYFEQWDKEIGAYFYQQNGTNEVDIDKPLYFLAIGGVSEMNAKMWSKNLLNQHGDNGLAAVKAMNWQDFCEYIIAISRDGASLSKQNSRILEDMLEGLRLYGLQTSPFKWGDILNHSLSTLDLELSSKVLDRLGVSTDKSNLQLNSLLKTHLPRLNFHQAKVTLEDK